MNRKSRFTTITFFLFFLIISQPIVAQDYQKKEDSIVRILTQISQQYQCSFSYADDTLKNIYIQQPINYKLPLSEVLDFLATQTHLKFKQLANNIIAISKVSKNQPPTTATKTPQLLTHHLREILITKYLTKGISKTNLGSLTFKPAKFGILPGQVEPDVLHTLQALPGVLNPDERISNIHINGGTHDQNLILWDGIKMYQTGHFFGLISAFNPHLTQKVTIIKNGTSAQYGDGVSSMINIQQYDSIPKVFNAGAGINFINADVFIKLPIHKKMSLQVAARRAITDATNTPTYTQYFNYIFSNSDLSNSITDKVIVNSDKQFSFYDVEGKIIYKPSKNDNIQLSFLNIANHLTYQENSTLNNLKNQKESFLKQDNFAMGIKYTKKWSAKTTSTTQLNSSSYKLSAKNNDITNNQILNQKNEVLEYTAKQHLNIKASKTILFNMGYQLTETGITNLEDVNQPRFKRLIKEVVISHTGYTEGIFSSKSKKTKAVLGGRFTNYQKFGINFIEPRLNFSQQFLAHFQLEILAEYKHQHTTQIIDHQNDFLGIEKRRWILTNNKDIPFLKSKQASIGINYNRNKLLITTTAFVKNVTGITTRSQGFQNQYQFVNAVGEYNILGFDFLINKHFNQFSTWLSYAYNNNQYTFDSLNNGDAFRNNNDINHAVTLATTYTHNKIKLALGANWHSGKPYTALNKDTPIVNNEINYNSPNAASIDDYLRVDFSGSYQLKFSKKIKGSIGVSILNVLNTKNNIHRYYLINNNNQILKIDNRSLGFTPNFNFRINF